MRVYIAGPMTGIEDFNYPAFHDAADELTAIGHEPINPARHGIVGSLQGWAWSDYMKAAIADLVTCGGIHLLDGWEGSRGARLEWNLAQELDLQHIGNVTR